MKSIYDLIKKQNGQDFANTIRGFDSGIFDIPDLLGVLKYAGREAAPLLEYLNSMKNIKIIEGELEAECPFELLARAGYEAQYADTHEKHIEISKYYKDSELVCFLRTPERATSHYIINAVKKDAHKIKRANFTDPKRDDEYGTSVISIHILKSGGFICITNRYNHTVSHPDNTFESNPDNIIDGLSTALKKHFKVDFSSSKVPLPDGYQMAKGKIFKYNYEVNGVYFREDAYVANGKICPLDHNHQIMLDYFLFDIKDKSISNVSKIADGFASAFTEEIENEKPQLVKNETGGRSVLINGKPAVSVKDGKITYVNLEKPTDAGQNFLHRNMDATEVNLPNVPNQVFAKNLLENNGLAMGKIYFDYGASLRKKHLEKSRNN